MDKHDELSEKDQIKLCFYLGLMSGVFDSPGVMQYAKHRAARDDYFKAFLLSLHKQLEEALQLTDRGKS